MLTAVAEIQQLLITPALPDGRFSKEQVQAADDASEWYNSLDKSHTKNYGVTMRTHNAVCDALEGAGLKYVTKTANVFLVEDRLYYWPSGKARFKGRSKVYQTRSIGTVIRLVSES